MSVLEDEIKFRLESIENLKMKPDDKNEVKQQLLRIYEEALQGLLALKEK